MTEYGEIHVYLVHVLTSPSTFKVYKVLGYKFDVHVSVHRKPIFKYNQQNATLHNLFVSVKCSTCFRRLCRQSSGAHNCMYCIGYFVKLLLLPATAVAGSGKGLTKYPVLYIEF